jgi:hypothetical protein
MSTEHIPVLEAAVLPDKKKMKTVYTIGFVLFALACGAAAWGWFFYDEYTELMQDVITGEVSREGPASAALTWGSVFAIAIPVMYGLMWMNTDMKNPSLGANSQGLFLNRNGFKKAFIRWEDFGRIEKKNDGAIWLYMKNPEAIIAAMPGSAKVFLKKTYVTDQSPIVLSAESADDPEQRVMDVVSKHIAA